MTDTSKEEKMLGQLWKQYGTKGQYSKFAQSAWKKGIPNWMTNEYLRSK